MRTAGKSPTMKDVAREAGVALGTVSKVFNGIPVGDSYRQKVEEAANRLGYRVNNYARGLKTNRTNTVALILPYTAHPYFGRLADSVCEALSRRDYRAMLAITQADPQTEARCIQMVRQNKVDGIIALTYASDLEVGDDLPYVSIDRFISPGIPCIAGDNFGGGQLAAEKLAALGCKRLLFLRTGSDIPGEPDKRGAGFEAYCQMKGIEYSSLKLSEHEGLEPFTEFLRAHFSEGRCDFDGIFCVTDIFCLHIKGVLESLGVRVPEEVQMIGFDGIRDFGTNQLFCSTIAQPVEQIAEAAVSVLLNRDRSQLPALMCLPVSYAPGGTTRE